MRFIYKYIYWKFDGQISPKTFNVIIKVCGQKTISVTFRGLKRITRYFRYKCSV